MSTFVTMNSLGLLAEILWAYLKLYNLLFSLSHAKKLKWFMNSKHYIKFISVAIFLFSLLQRSVSRSDSKQTLFNNTFLFTCLMTEPVLSSFVLTKGNMRGRLLPQSANNCGLGIVSVLCIIELCFQSCCCAHRLACYYWGIQKTINICIEWRVNINYRLKWLGNEVKDWVVSPGKAIKVLLTTSDNMKDWFRIKTKGAIRTFW